MTHHIGAPPDDGRRYGVIEVLHGYRGSPESIVGALHSAAALQAAIDAHRIPPSILVVPSLNVDNGAHDCANLSGRPAVGTWVAQEVPRMVEATFPNVSHERSAWMLAGLSAGAYCAGWGALAAPAQFAAAGVMSSYDPPTEGGLATSGRAIADEYTLSRLVAAATPTGTRFYALGAQDDPLGAARAAWAMDAVVRKPDSVTVDTPVTGGHAWPLWVDRFPTLLRWWGEDPAVWSAVGLAAVLGGALLVAGAAGALPRWHGRSLLGGRGGAVAARVGAFVLRPAALLVVAVVLAAAIGLGANAAGGYYTSWGDILSMVAG